MSNVTFGVDSFPWLTLGGDREGGSGNAAPGTQVTLHDWIVTRMEIPKLVSQTLL